MSAVIRHLLYHSNVFLNNIGFGMKFYKYGGNQEGEGYMAAAKSVSLMSHFKGRY